jgi:peroxiredoxin
VHSLQIVSNDSTVSPFDSIDHSLTRVANGEFASPLLVDSGQAVARSWGARHTPEVFLLDGDGRVAYHGAPDEDSENESAEASWVREALEAVLSDQSVERPSTPPMGCTIKWTL